MNISLGGNYIDLIILVVLAYFISEAFRVGFWVLWADAVGFFLSLLFSLRFYKYLAVFLRDNFSLTNSVANAISFILMAGLMEFLLGSIFIGLVKKIPYKYWKKPIFKILGIIPALGEGIILTAFILILALGLPIAGRIKGDITNSKIGGLLVARTSGLETRINEIFGGLIDDSLTYLTIRPDSSESVRLNVDETNLSVDFASERGMIDLVNLEREKRGIKKLIWSDSLSLVGRSHAEDMWKRRYFSHYSPEGEDVGDRLDEASILYTYAGENLALAPTLVTAHNGLMNSEGHRENILNTDFFRLGVGVIDNGIYGKIFVQVFSD